VSCGEVEYLRVKLGVRDLLQDAGGCIVGLGPRPRWQNQCGPLAGQRQRVSNPMPLFEPVITALRPTCEGIFA